MEYYRKIQLKDGRECILRNGTAEDGSAVLECFDLTHGQTDHLLTYPEENSFTVEAEEQFLRMKTESPDEIEILAEVDGYVAGTAGFGKVGDKMKIRHRAEFGISVDEEYWGLGIGGALTSACVECAKKAGLLQLELDVVSDNTNAISLYEKAGFREYGRNPMGFRRKDGSFQELVLMRLELDRA